MSVCMPLNHRSRALLMEHDADTITYSFTILGILRAGHIAFPISLRNSHSAVAHLLQQTNCKHVLVSRDRSTQTLAQEATAELSDITSHYLLALDEMRSSVTGSHVMELPTKYDAHRTAVILHSSGTQCFLQLELGTS